MKRLEFIKNLFVGGLVGLASSSSIPLNKDIDEEKEYLFEELFIINEKNTNLILPIRKSEIYQKLKSIITDKLVNTTSITHYPVRDLSITIKKKYKYEDFLPIVYFLEKTKYSDYKFVEYETYGEYEKEEVFYRFVKNDTNKSMEFNMFVYYGR